MTRLLETQVVDDASRARSRAGRKHNTSYVVSSPLNTLATNRALIPSFLWSIPACCHSLLAEGCAHILDLVHSKLFEPVEFLQLGLRPLLSLRNINKRVQQFSSVLMAVELLCRVLILSSRYCDSSHYHTPFTSRMLCLWRHVLCRGFGCSLGRFGRPDQSFRSRRRQRSRRKHKKNICTQHSLRLTSGSSLSLSLVIHVLQYASRSLC